MSKQSTVINGVLKTTCYADIFDYPLTVKEIYRWYISYPKKGNKISIKDIEKAVKKDSRIKNTNNYIHIKGHSKTVSFRNKRRSYSKEKIKIAKRVGKWLKIIPSVKAVVITGALAMENSSKDDDIDLLIITANNSLWLTRLLVVLLVSLVAKRRTPEKQINSPTMKKWNNAICLNLFLDETALSIPKSKRNLYIAHEVAQTKFLWSRDKTKEKFLSQNSWILDYLPNVEIPKKIKDPTSKGKLLTSHRSLTEFIVGYFENIAFKLQISYMKPKITREIIDPHQAFFHPRKTSSLILNKYKQRLKSI